MLTTVYHAQLHDASDFLAEAHAAGAMDAAAHLFHGDQRTDVLVGHHTLFFFVARTCTAVTDGQVLQLALTALIADGAIQGVVNQQELHHRLLRLDGFLALGTNDHALRHRRGACRQRLGRLFHINQAHAAVGSNGQLLVVAKMRNVGASLLSSMHDHAAGSDLHLLAV